MEAVNLVRSKNDEEFTIFFERYLTFMNLYTVYQDVLSGHYKPTLQLEVEGWPTSEMQLTLLMVLYSFFYSLIEDDNESVNAFRIWRCRYPSETHAISLVEECVKPFKDDLRQFRNKIGFHGSRSRDHEARGFELFSKHSGTEILNGMKRFKALSVSLLAKEHS